MKLARFIGRVRTSRRDRRNPRSMARGMTLLELTVVIVVLLGLVGVFAIGAAAWKKGSNRVLCIMNLQAVQKGVRSYANLYGYEAGATVPGLQAQVIGDGAFVQKMPECPGSGIYTPGGDVVPDLGTLYLNCSLSNTGEHEPLNAEDW